MNSPPTDVLTAQLEEAIAGRRVRAALFTTFCLEPAFFEQEVLTALFDVTWHHVPKVRALQLEDLLRPLSGKVAVYYDHRSLIEGDRSPSLDVRRIPCWPGTGYFHPKLTFVLLDGALVVMCGSANLTRAGWWENVEAAVIEELSEGQPTRMHDELVAFADHLRTHTRGVHEHAALDEIRRFLRTTSQVRQRSAAGHLHTHFYANGRSSAQTLVDFVADSTGGAVNRWSLDVVSPYVDDAATSQPLARLLARFNPRSVRVLLPEINGVAACSHELYEDVRKRGAVWSRLPRSMTARGQDERATTRFVHAKVYRFFSDTREIIFVGSANLTNAGHQSTGNVEAGMLIERRHNRRQRHWMSPVEEPPAFFSHADEGEDATDFAPKLVLRYDWSRQELAALWASSARNPRLEMRAYGVPVFELPAGLLPEASWCHLRDVAVSAVEERLVISSFLTAVDEAGREATLLVLEIGMAHRPSVLLQLSPAEILQYWALLTPEQRAEFAGARGDQHGEIEGGEALVPRRQALAKPESMFDRFAGMFHGFASLSQKVTEALDEGRASEAEFLVVGRKPDSLRRLVDRVAERTDAETRVDDHLLLLCAEQLVRYIRSRWPDFWKQRPEQAISSGRSLSSTIREALTDETDDDDMVRFLDWHEKKFLQPARRPA